MEAVSPEGSSLAKAQQEIENLLERLNQTIEIAGELANSGQDQAALELLARERKHLHVAVDNVSRDISTDQPRKSRHKVLLFIAAAIGAVSLSSLAFAAMHESPDDALTEARQDLRDAIVMTDARGRADALEQIRADLAALPTDLDGRAAVEGDLQDAVEDESMSERADRVRQDVETMTADPSNPKEQDVRRTKTDVERLLD